MIQTEEVPSAYGNSTPSGGLLFERLALAHFGEMVAT
jgi:hypothetical protein